MNEANLMSSNNDIKIDFDDVSKDHYIIWRLPIAIGSGNTEIEALHDLREAARFCLDSLIGLKIKEVSKED